MFTWLFWLMLAFAAADWVATWRGWRRVRWVTKPAALILLIALFTQLGGWQGVLLWFGLGFVFSLAGDVLLQLPRAFFLPGMAAFFLAHLFYIIGFTQHPLDLDWRLIVPIAGIAITYYELTKRIRAGLRTQDQPEMVIPVSGYAVILSLMLFFAISTAFRPAWDLVPVILVSLGAALFYFSDASLAYNRFVHPLPAGDLRVMVTYHLGQILLATGALLQYA